MRGCDNRCNPSSGMSRSPHKMQAAQLPNTHQTRPQLITQQAANSWIDFIDTFKICLPGTTAALSLGLQKDKFCLFLLLLELYVTAAKQVFCYWTHCTSPSTAANMSRPILQPLGRIPSRECTMMVAQRKW